MKKVAGVRWQVSGLVVVAGIALLYVAGHLNPHLADLRSPSSDLRPPTSDLRSPTATPPLVTMTTVVLGGFRGIVADLLWLRAAELQDEGRYFELVQLADWITTLEPQFAEIWVFHAWNMAYNISVMMPDDVASWRWVQNSIKLLRERGKTFCPTDPKIYHELGMIYLHKIGGDTDPSAAYYRRKLAKQMMDVVGPTGRLAETANPTSLAGLDPEAMREVDALYGPLDWRVAETHALYWAHLGARIGGEDGVGDARCRRMITHAMMGLFDHGRLTHSEEEDLFVASPEFDLLASVIATFERAIAESPELKPEVAYASFLDSAVKTSHFYHRKEEARELFDMLHSRFPSRATARGFETFARSGGPSLPRFLSSNEED